MATLPAGKFKGRTALGDRRQTSPTSSHPVYANFASSKFVIGAGVAIFHLASSRVVVCYHSKEKHWFLPKGRRDVHETTEQGAEREGYEESGYRNRLLPLPIPHRQPQPHAPGTGAQVNNVNVTQPVWLQFLPQSRSSQYLLHWYIAETLPPDIEASLNEAAEEQGRASETNALPYQSPPPFPKDLSLKKRLALEPEGYEPVKHEGTGADDDEALYVSYLLPIEEAKHKLRASLQCDVVSKGWEAIQMRSAWEEDEGPTSSVNDVPFSE